MKKIESVLLENRSFKPSDNFSSKANIPSLDKYNELCSLANSNYEKFWGDLANKHLDWDSKFTKILDDENKPFFKWFTDGQLNASYNCIDRHLKDKGQKIALIFESDDGDISNVTYSELHKMVCKLANGLSSLGLIKGDRVIIYMPMSIEAVVAMHACARIGLTHSVVFGGFSSKSLQERIDDAEAKCVITADGQKRGGKEILLNSIVDEALDNSTKNTVKNRIIYQRLNKNIEKREIDTFFSELVKDQSDNCEPVPLDSEHPLFLLYTSGSTGKPKGIQHSTAGYLLHSILTMLWTFDYKESDIFWCTADVGWITGHTYVAYGPLAVGATQVIFEGVPTYPKADRFWKLIENHKVSVFYTAPTAIRSLIKLGSELPNNYDLSSLRLLGTVGEPINPEAWMWYYETIGKSKCPIVDTWWQTETGGHMLTPLPGVTKIKPGSCAHPLPGIIADIVDDSGDSVEKNQGGTLVIKKPWPSMIRNIWGDPERYKATYFPKKYDENFYVAGDGARKDDDDFFWIMGRIDDVLNVSGHRLGTMEIESALVANQNVAEAAVVGKPHDVKGEAIVAFVVLKGSIPNADEQKEISINLRNWVGKEIGPIAKPDEIRFGDNLPKTRSGKIMRRLLRTLAKNEEITQDTSTLENPAILDQLKKVN